jgi:integrase
MATIYKRRKGKNEPYSIQYLDHHGKRKTVKGFTDRGLTDQLAGKLEAEARLRRTGMIDVDQERLAETKHSAVSDHLTAFEKSLADNSPKHIKLTMTRVRRVVTGCGFETLAGIIPEAVQVYLRSLRKADDLGHRTYNHYLQALDAFCNWCVTTKRLFSNPLLGLERLNTAVDVRHARRALTTDEVSKLVGSARDSGLSIQRFTGEQRARIYLLSYMTGLRKKELASLTPRSFALKAVPPTVTVEAACSKHRRKDVLPLHPDLVVMLRDWLKGLAPSDMLFPQLDRRKTWLMVKKDLERAGIPYETADGIADFHAAGRHTHITELLRNGASLPEAKELARHSDINMTMRYTHIGIGDQARAVAKLPTPKSNTKPADSATRESGSALQMRCILGGVEGHSASSAGNEASAQERQNPCRGKGFVTDRRQMSSTGKMEAAGIEPASREVSVGASTCVVGSFTLFACQPPTDGVPSRPARNGV